MAKKVIRVAPTVLSVITKAGYTREQFTQWVVLYGDDRKVNKKLAEEFIEDQNAWKEVANNELYNVILTSVKGVKLKTTKVIMTLLNMNLRNAKALVDNAPSTLKEKVRKKEANQLKAALEAVGATVELVESENRVPPTPISAPKDVTPLTTLPAPAPSLTANQVTITAILAGGRSKLIAKKGQTLAEAWSAAAQFTVRTAADEDPIDAQTYVLTGDVTILVYKKDDGGVA